METEIYQAFISAGVNEDKARAAADWVKKEIDQRYSAHGAALVTVKDIDGMENRLRLELATSVNKLQGVAYTCCALVVTVAIGGGGQLFNLLKN